MSSPELKTWSLRANLRCGGIVLLAAGLTFAFAGNAAAAKPFDEAMKILKDPKSLAGKLDTARAKLEQAAKADPKNSHATYNLGLVLQRQGNDAGARAQWQATLRNDPKYYSAAARLAELDLRGGNKAGAQSRLEGIIKDDRFQAEARNLLAEIAIGNRKWDEAIVHARNVLLGDPNNTNAYLNMALAYYRQGLVDQAWLVTQNALNRKPNAAALHNLMGLIHLKRDDSRSATDSFLQALKVDPDQMDALLNLATLELAYGAFDSALKRLDIAIERDPKNADLVLTRAVALRGLDRFDDAAKGYEAALKLRPRWLDAEYNLCVLHHQFTRKYELALTRCRGVLQRLQPKHKKGKEMRRRVKSIEATIEALRDSAAPATPAPPADTPPTDAPPADGEDKPDE